MIKGNTVTRRLTMAAILGLGAIISAGVVAKGAGAKKPELSGLGDAKWAPLMKGAPLPALSAIEGDPMAGPFFAYMKLPAGFESPAHTHSNDYWAVLVQGKMTHWATEGGSEAGAKQLGVGDLTHMPAHIPHVSKCYPGEDCVMVVMEKAKFDFVPVKK